MIKLPLRVVALILLLVLVTLVSCRAVTGQLSAVSFPERNPASPAEDGQSQQQSAEDSPLIHHASVEPTKVRPGDTMVVTAEVSDSSGIKSVTADMGGIDTISLSLIEGSVYHGTWQGQWLVHDTTVRDYVTTIVATNALGKSSTSDVVWRDPQTYERYHRESYVPITDITTEPPSWYDALTITFSPNVTGNFWLFARADLTNTSTATYTEARVVYDSIVISTCTFYPASVDEVRNYGASTIIVTLDSALTYSFKIQVRTGAAATGTAGIRSYGMSIFSVSSDSIHNAGADDNTLNETWVNNATITFTPGTPGDYLVIAAMEMAGNNLNRSYLVQLDEGGTPHGVIVRDPGVLNNYEYYTIMRKINLANTEHTFTIQYMSESGGGSSTSYIRNSHLCAIRIDDLGTCLADAYLESEALDSTNSTTYILKQTVPTSMTFDHATEENAIRLLWGLLGTNSKTGIAYGMVEEDTVSLGESTIASNEITDFVPLWSGFFRYYDSTSHNLKLYYKADGLNEAKVKNVRLMAIRADTLNPFFDSGHTIYDDDFQAGQNTVYIQGCYFSINTSLHVAYYDANDYQWLSHGVTSDDNGVVNSQYTFTSNPTAKGGMWHAVIYDDSQTPLGTYSENDPNSLREVAFNVAQAAIPEFPTVIAAIGVAGLCFGIYWWMRKRMVVSRQTVNRSR